jgi:hypothetical protein
MKFDAYKDIHVTDDFENFEFVSTGKNGDVLKRVSFTRTEDHTVYNLAFGDVDGDNEINDYAVTDNGDRNKVLTTIAAIVGIYTRRFPDRWIIFKGSTEERMRLYRMAVGLHLEELSSLYEISAFVDEEIVAFQKNMKINAFLIKRKKL